MKKFYSVFLILIFLSCASTNKSERADWIYNKPTDTKSTLYFVGGPGFDRNMAQIKAYREIARIISTEIESITELDKEVIATESGKEFVEKFTDYIRTISNARISGVEFIEFYLDEKKQEWWVLGEIDRKTLEQLIIEKSKEFTD